MKTKLIILAIVIIVLGGGWYYYKNNQSIPSDWLTYSNEEYGYEFTYPESLSLDKHESEVSVSDPERGHTMVFGVNVLQQPVFNLNEVYTDPYVLAETTASMYGGEISRQEKFGYDVAKIDYFRHGPNDEQIPAQLYIVIKERKVYALTSWYFSNPYASMIIDSFRFTK